MTRIYQDPRVQPKLELVVSGARRISPALRVPYGLFEATSEGMLRFTDKNGNEFDMNFDNAKLFSSHIGRLAGDVRRQTERLSGYENLKARIADGSIVVTWHNKDHRVRRINGRTARRHIAAHPLWSH